MFKLEHIGVVVRDADRSIEFYRQAFGAEIESQRQDERVRLVFLQVGGATIELVQYLQASDETRGAGAVDHIAMAVEDMEAAIAQVKAAGATPLFDAPRQAGPGKKIMFLAGPDGERLELVHVEG